MDPNCAGQTCDTFSACGPGGSCVCASIAGGSGFCADGQTPCAGLATCRDNGDCSLDEVCAVGTCCTRNVCIKVGDTCGNEVLPRFVFARRSGRVRGETVGGFPL